MHIRFNTCRGTPVLEEGGDSVLGVISSILIDPDTGKIEGFMVHAQGFMGTEDLFCSSADILRWGTRVYVRDASVLAPPEDRIRLQSLLQDPRTVLGQKIRTESGVRLGRCKDIQFNTDVMHIEWLFPKKLFRWAVALPVADIIEVTPSAIIIGDLVKKERIKNKAQKDILSMLPEMEPGVSFRT
ncbi:MAG: PRC-barrel domain-containing protein [bacterium]|nr:PRC-barrel domain-containing protein [bacterium]